MSLSSNALCGYRCCLAGFRRHPSLGRRRIGVNGVPVRALATAGGVFFRICLKSLLRIPLEFNTFAFTNPSPTKRRIFFFTASLPRGSPQGRRRHIGKRPPGGAVRARTAEAPARHSPCTPQGARSRRPLRYRPEAKGRAGRTGVAGGESRTCHAARRACHAARRAGSLAAFDVSTLNN